MFTGTEDHSISFEVGAALTRSYRDANPDARKGGYYSKEAIQQLLDQDKCVGIRIYFGISGTGQPEMVIVGVESNENDLVGSGNKCMDVCIPCPNRCGDDNILNSD